jgi:hypothetical protein
LLRAFFAFFRKAEAEAEAEQEGLPIPGQTKIKLSQRLNFRLLALAFS